MTDQKKLRPRQVAAYQSLRPVMVDESATCGAQIGVNLLLPDGTVGTLAQLAALFGSAAPASSDGSNTLTTTDDLEEGQWNLWFTNRRAQDAVGAILANSANVTLTYAGGASITADLTTITDAGGGTLQKTAFDAYGRKTGTSAATTADLTEGSHLYFTSARASAAAPIQSLVAGSNVTIDVTDPKNPVVNSTGAGAVDSVNGQTGVAVLTAADVGAATTAQGAKADSAVQSVVAGANVTVDNTDPLHPVVSATGSGGITVHFPFFLADTSAANIALTGDQKVPFFLADGSAANIALTT